jgi:hypothetical protein
MYINRSDEGQFSVVSHLDLAEKTRIQLHYVSTYHIKASDKPNDINSGQDGPSVVYRAPL